jgi:hypothetical protein
MMRLRQGPWFCLGLILLLGGLAGCGDDERPDVPLESVVVDVVMGLSAPVDRVVTVDLRTSAAVTLELGTPLAEAWHDMLAHSQQYSRPVYLEIVSETRRIVAVALPIVSPVQALNETEAGFEVALVYSAAVHYLYRTTPGFQEMLGLLQDALATGDTLVITEKDGPGIVDVRADAFSGAL